MWRGKMGNCLRSLVLVLVALRTSRLAAGDCRRNCGGLEIPYPFGLDGDSTSCYGGGAFRLTCNTSYSPPRPFQGNTEVISISLPAAKLRILLNLSYDCYDANGDNRWGTWDTSLAQTQAYANTFSDKDNVFTGVGCDTLAQIKGPKDQSFTGGCLSVCDNSSNILDGECSGIGCCQAAVPKGLQRYSTSFDYSHNHSGITGFNPCSYSFLVEKGNYTFNKSDLAKMDTTRGFPVVLDWAIDTVSCPDAVKNKTSYACISSNSVCLNATSTDVGYFCNCSQGFQGNPYLLDGCQDIDECKDPHTYPCNGTCTNLMGSYNCTCPVGFTGDPKVGCRPLPPKSSKFPTAIIVPVVVASSLLVTCLGIWGYSLLQKRKLNEIKEKYFLQNGGKLLQRRISTSAKNEEEFKIFSREEIEKATNKYDQAFILGRGGQGVVYKGILPNDSRTFAIKKSVVMDGSKIDEFVNELVVLSKVNHRNIVKLVGCCLEVEDPLLVYEFVENGTLSEHLKFGTLPWDARLKIASETAGALGYLHSSTNTPIIHRDVKSSNILLDKQYNAKVSDFGASKLVPIEETQVQTVVMGTLGYLDPEYMLTHQLTEKSDVYSFGVVLVELLTGKAPISYEKTNTQRCLAMHFMSCMKDGNLEDILDARILSSDMKGQIKDVAMIAKSCLSISGENRPQMVEVAMELEQLRRNSSHPWNYENIEDIHVLLNDSSRRARRVSKLMPSEETHLFNTGDNISALNIESGR